MIKGRSNWSDVDDGGVCFVFFVRGGGDDVWFVECEGVMCEVFMVGVV